MRVGDLICILDGCMFPMILRRQEYVYRLVGAGHVNGNYERRSGRGVEGERRNNPDL
jgi:hypothetical protein